MTKRFAIYVVLLSVFLAAPGFGQRGGHGGWSGGQGRQQPPSVDDQLKTLTKQLQLTDDQQPKVRDILQNRHDQIQQVMQDTSTPRAEKWSKMREIHETTNGKIRALLTDDQKKKFDDYLQKQQEHQQQQRGRGVGMGSQS